MPLILLKKVQCRPLKPGCLNANIATLQSYYIALPPFSVLDLWFDDNAISLKMLAITLYPVCVAPSLP